MAQQLSYVPHPSEQPYYEALFQFADVARGGNIGGAEAVAFFSRSKLQIETLKNIWTLADTPSSNALDRRKFAIAIRLIQLAQNGVKAQGATLGGPPNMRPAMFDGVSGVTIPLPPPPGQQGPPPPQQQQQQHQQQGLPPPQQQHGPPPQQHQQQQQGPPPPQQQQYPPQGPPPQQQYPPQGGPPPQQPQYHQQAPPSPIRSANPQQQYQQPVPPTPPRPQTPVSAPHPESPRPPMGLAPPTFSTALTPQDPYSMTPQEQARYEDLFPQYAKPDGFIYGGEAVALFSKSGVDRGALGKIWNLVDLPVDNRLDKLEFAMAMHLIVCISKKGLAIPTALPISMKATKSQAQAAAAGANMPSPPASITIQRPSTPDSDANHPPTIGGYGAPPPAEYNPPQYMQPAPPQQQQFSQPPPLPPPGGGGMAISDAFEGLNPGEPLSPSYGGGPPSYTHQPEPSYIHQPEPTPVPHKVETIPEPEPVARSAPAPAPSPPPKTTQQLASSYAMGDDSSELAKLKATLQKLQAENISLKAQMGSMSIEEKEIQRETMATVSEIARLLPELSELRGQVLSTKERLLESTAHLTANKEKKQVLADLIDETQATIETLEAAEQDIHEASERNPTASNAAPPAGSYVAPPTATYTAPLAEAPAPAVASVPEADLFGDWGDPPSSGQAPAPWGAPSSDGAPAPWKAMIEPTASADSSDPGGARDFDRNPFDGSSAVNLDLGYALGAPSTEYPGNVMGGGLSTLSNINSSYSAPPLETVVSKDAIDDLKKAAIAAEEAAREQEELYRNLAKQTDELKKASDAAEAEAIALQEKAGNKKGFGKKKAAKDAEQASIDAAEKKKHFLEFQAQTSSAQALVLEKKKEADRLRDQAENAEISYASAESTKDSQPSYGAPAPAAPENTKAAPSTYGGPPAYGAAPAYGGGIMQSNGGGIPEPDQSYPSYGINPSQSSQAFTQQGFGNGFPAPNNQTSDDSFSFGSGVMGGGGISIPTPHGDGDYNNPF